MASMMLPSPGSRGKVLRHLKHMEPLKKRRGGKFANLMPFNNKTFVPPQDRVAFWNIAPGDEVRVRVGGVRTRDDDGKRSRTSYEGIVDTIDRERNVAYLRAPEGGDESRIPRNIKHLEPRYADAEKGKEGGFGPNTAYVARPVHYSNLQLKIPSDLKLPSDVKLDLKSGVYASRLTRSTAAYDRSRGHFVWRRYALVKTDEGTLKIEVPWKKGVGEREAQRKPNTTLSYVVDTETWQPWAPDAPTWLLPFRKYTSPHALERHQTSMAQSAISAAANGAGSDGRTSLATAAARAAARAAVQIDASTASASGEASAAASLNVAASMLPGASTSSRGLPVYEGFAKQLLKKAKIPKLPQPPSPAEQLWMAKHDMQQWRTENEEAAAAAAEEPSLEAKQSFSAFDYLDVAPLEGGETGKSGFVDENVPVRRRSSDGRLIEGAEVSKTALDSWPIELLMKDDLMNENGAKHRRLRWQAKQLIKAEDDVLIEEQERENLRLFRQMKLTPTMTQSSSS